MSDFNGEPLIFRDDLERAFWGRVLASVIAAHPTTGKGWHPSKSPSGDWLSAEADGAVVAMRERQGTITREIYENRSMVARRCCAVCLRPEGQEDTAGHAPGCPRGRKS